MSNEYKTPSYTRDAVKRYSEKITIKKFTAKSDTDRGRWLDEAKKDSEFNDKFWKWLESEYAKS